MCEFCEQDTLDDSLESDYEDRYTIQGDWDSEDESYISDEEDEEYDTDNEDEEPESDEYIGVGTFSGNLDELVELVNSNEEPNQYILTN